MARAYRYISADSHLEISPESWRKRVPKKHRERAPRLIQLADGSDAILVENRPLNVRWVHGAGVPFERWGLETGMRYDETAGAGPPEQRLKEQDMDGIDAEILFADVGGRSDWSGIADDGAYHAVVWAYNEFLAEEYCAVDPDRLIGMGIIPERGIEGAIAELEHCARLGFKAVNLSRYPSAKPFPTPEDDRFWAAALDADMPVTIHTEFADSERRGGTTQQRGPDLARRICTYGVKAAPIAAALAVSGVFDRFPKLQVYFAENQIGWIPNYLEQMDVLYERHRYYHERMQGLKPLSRLPSEIVKEHCLWGFMDNPIGVQLRHHVGVDKVMWSSDFPHAPTDWPHSMQTIERNFAGVPAEEKYLMVAGNAVRFFRLNEEE